MSELQILEIVARLDLINLILSSSEKEILSFVLKVFERELQLHVIVQGASVAVYTKVREVFILYFQLGPGGLGRYFHEA